MLLSDQDGKKRTRRADEYSMEATSVKVSAPPKVLLNDEIADQIKQMFADVGFVEKPVNRLLANRFNTISNLVLDLIMKQLADVDKYRPMYEEYISKREHSKAHIKAKKFEKQIKPISLGTFYLKKFYQLQYVDKRFADYFVRRVKDLPKVDIGLRIQPKPDRVKPGLTKEDKGKVIYSIHDGYGIIPSNVCDYLHNIAQVLRFGRVKSHLTVFGLPLDDNLLAAIKKIDTSNVQRALFLNIPYVDFEGDVKKRGQELLSMFSNVEVLQFNGCGYDHDAVFGDNTDFEDSAWLRDDHELSAAEMTHQCADATYFARSPKGVAKFNQIQKYLQIVAPI